MTTALDGWWHLYDFTPAYRYVGRRSHVVIKGPWGEKSLCGRIWNLDRRDGDGYRKCAECLRRMEARNV